MTPGERFKITQDYYDMLHYILADIEAGIKTNVYFMLVDLNKERETYDQMLKFFEVE